MGAFLVSMDVTSLYTNIPQEKGIQTICKAFDAYYENKPPIPTNLLNLIYSISHLYFTYKLSFLLHSLLENGARMTPKRRSVFLLIFIVNCI